MSPNNYQFREELLQVHRPNRRMDFAKDELQSENPVCNTKTYSLLLRTDIVISKSRFVNETHFCNFKSLFCNRKL